jgi:5-methylcytosine-specific restriction enzyme subunit McrC
MEDIISQIPGSPASPSPQQGGTSPNISQPSGTQRAVYAAIEQEPVAVPLVQLLVGDRLDIYPEVQRKDFFAVHLSNDRLVFQARGFVGLIPINDAVAIDVQPRVPVNNLERILFISQLSPIFLARHPVRYTPHTTQPESLLDFLTEGLLSSIAPVESLGMFRTYEERVEDTSFPKGRVLLKPTITRHESRGIRYRVTASWFDPTVDNAPNRCLKYALWALGKRYQTIRLDTHRRELLSRLNYFYHSFASVGLDTTMGFLADRYVLEPGILPSIRRYYEAPIHLALAIIRNQGVAFGHSGGPLVLSTLLIKLQEVFEGYVREVLKRIHLSDSSCRVLNGNSGGADGGKKPLFDTDPSEAATPDIIVSKIHADRRTVSYPVVLDAKYKRVVDGPSREDVYQVIAYGVSYRSRAAILVHPALDAASRGLRRIGRIAQLDVYQYGFDLNAADLTSEEDEFRQAILPLVGPVNVANSPH